jgi:hypothetical protein
MANPQDVINAGADITEMNLDVQAVGEKRDVSVSLSSLNSHQNYHLPAGRIQKLLMTDEACWEFLINSAKLAISICIYEILYLDSSFDSIRLNT